MTKRNRMRCSGCGNKDVKETAGMHNIWKYYKGDGAESERGLS